MIPRRNQLTFRLHEDVPKQTAKRALIHEMTTRELPPELARWILRELKIVAQPGGTFYGLRNAGVTVRAAKLSDVEAAMGDSESRISEGWDFRRVGACAKIPIQRLMKEKVQSIRDCSIRLGMLLGDHLVCA